ncbi:MAG: tetratricopeptide repeat-containing protein [Pseudomonadota bacterium]
MPPPTPIAFMIMPYGERPVPNPPPGGPASIDFDALWDRAYQPALAKLGYQPIRADADLGGLIIKDMLERIVLAHFVLADITLPNANVYYEVGVRHAASRNRCVLVAADWSVQPFDLQQIPQLRISLRDGAISESQAAGVRDQLLADIPTLREGTSPVHDAVPGYPDASSPDAANSFRDFVRDASEFDGRVRAIRGAAPSEQGPLIEALAAEVTSSPEVLPGVAVEVLYLVRDQLGWQPLLDYIERLPNSVQDLPLVAEQKCLAQSKSGDHLQAIAGLEALMALSGRSAEREGLLGGRYKKLMLAATNDADRSHYRDLAIQHYQAGSDLDLNDYYPACNLPRLYRQRGADGDEALAERAAAVAVAGVTCSMARDPDDEWAKPTLLGAAFDLGNLDEARRLAAEVAAQGVDAWKLDTTIADLETAVSLHPDAGTQAGLREVLRALRGLID